MLPFVFGYGVLGGPRTTPVELAVLAVAGSWGVLCVKYLARSGSADLGEIEIFRRALRSAGVAEPERWTFLWKLSMGIVFVSFLIGWFGY